jgi:hypothetical protein
MKLEKSQPWGRQYQDALKHPLCNPLSVVHPSDPRDLCIDAGSSQLIDSSTCWVINGATTAVTMLSAMVVTPVGLATKAVSSERWWVKPLCLPAVPGGIVLGAVSAALHVATGVVMTGAGAVGALLGATFLPVELSQRELKRQAEVSQRDRAGLHGPSLPVIRQSW